MIRRRIGPALWLLAAAMLFFFENNTGTRVILFASILIPLVSVFCSWQTARMLRASLSLPASCMEGEKTAAQITFNLPPVSLFCCVQAEITCANRITGKTQTLHASASGPLAIDTTAFGVTDIEVSRITVSDWFGVSAFRSTADNSVEMTILPVLYPVQLFLAPPESIRQDVSAAYSGRSAEETMGVRPYLPGDPIRMIHWKLSARMDETLLRETGTPQEDRILFLLDAACSSNAADTDRLGCVKAFLSAAQSLCEEGRTFLACIVTDSANALQLYEVTSTEENALLTADVLCTSINIPCESIGTMFAERYPELISTRTILFAPAPETDAASLYRGHRVTLVLPQQSEAHGSAEIAVQVLNENQTELEI